ncbi:unnamed protein product, partial [marine sediment metagenome]
DTTYTETPLGITTKHTSLKVKSTYEKAQRFTSNQT